MLLALLSAGLAQAQSPLDDTDHDRFPDVYETAMGGDAANPAITPNTAHANFITVDPSIPTSVPNRNYTTIQAAINAIPTSAYGIVWVKPGTYQQSIVITNRHVLLISEPGSSPVTITPNANAAYSNYGTISIQTGGEDTVLEGLIFDKGLNPVTYVPWRSSAVGINLSSTSLNVAINNCLMRGADSPSFGDGIYVRYGTAWVTHCTITDNVSNAGSGIYVYYYGRLRLRNSIAWHNNNYGQVGVYVNSGLTDQVLITSSIVRGGAYGSNPNNPLLRANNQDISSTSSPAMDAGSPLNDSYGVTLIGAPGVDLRGHPRNLLTPDMGAYEFTDTDADGLPDWWETQYFGNLTQGASTDYDSDSLINSAEYVINTSPISTDTDSDGASDSQEVTATTNPLAVDTDLDGMNDGYEMLYSLNPLDLMDAMEDADGDRVPNLFEFALGQTDPYDALDRPAAGITVDPTIVTETSTLKKTITAAVSAYASSGNAWSIIEVKTGIYFEALTLSKAGLLLLGEASFRPPTICANTVAPTIDATKGNIVIDGFRVTHLSDVFQGRGINFTLPPYLLNTQAKVINCQIVNNLAWSAGGGLGSGIAFTNGILTVSNNVIAFNASWGGQHGIALGSGKLRLLNNIIWNPPLSKAVQPSTTQVSANVSSNLIGDATKNIIYGGALGAINADPLLDWDLRLRPGSPAINPTGSVPGSALPVADIQGETRDTVPDFGADEFIDTDADGLGDKWELAYFPSLTTTDADGDPDSDGLLNKWESLFDLDPTIADTDGNGLTDLRDALVNAHEVYTDSTSRADADSDGWSAIQELILGTSDTTADSNGDGVSDGLALRLGIALTGTDPDGDGLTTTQELALGTSSFLKDTDGDGVLDGADAFALDRSRSTLTPVSGDTTVPVIVLLKPSHATLIP